MKKTKIITSMPQRLTRKTARKCAMHLAIRDKAVEHLRKDDYFSKAQVLYELGYLGARGIKWIFVKEMIEEIINAKLTGVSKAFFDDGPKDIVKKAKEEGMDGMFKYIHGGAGRVNVGYVATNHDLNFLAIIEVELRQKQASGKANKVVARIDELIKEENGNPENVTKLESIKNKAEHPKRVRLTGVAGLKQLDKLVEGED